jgi:hypothetical protein
MEIKVKVLALVAITVIGLAMPLSAQPFFPVSNQNGATAGVFGTDVDNYLNVNNYGDVIFEKWFGYLGGNPLGIFNLGYATKFSNIYLGTFYEGNIFKTETRETTKLTTNWNTALQQMLSKTDEKTYGRTATNAENHISALIGVANMGIQVGFYENITTFNTPYNADRDGTSTVTTNQNGSITYSGNDSLSYEESEKDLIPYLQWGMKLNLGSNTLAPRIVVAVDFNEDKLIDKYYTSGRTEYQGKIVGTEDITREGHNYGYTDLVISAGADYYLNDSMYIGVDYLLNTGIFDRSFDDAGRSGSVKGIISYSGNNTTTNYYNRTEKSDSVGISVKELNYMSHTIVPALWKEWKGEKFGENLKLGVLVQVPITIENTSNNSYSDTWVTTETAYNDDINKQYNRTTIEKIHTAGDKEETSVLNIAPIVGVGVTYDLIPKKFTVNAGINVKVPSFSSKSTVTSQNGVNKYLAGGVTYANSYYEKTEMGYGSNKYTASETLEVADPTPVEDEVYTETIWTGLRGSIAGGFVFSFNDNFALDLLAKTDLTTDAFSINLTSLSVLFSIKF